MSERFAVIHMNKFRISALMLLTFIIFTAFVPNALANGLFYYDGSWHEYTANAVSLYLDGKILTPDVPPLIIENRTMVPVRSVFEQMGASVFWNESSKEVKIERGGLAVSFIIDSSVALVNGVQKYMDVPAKIVGSADTTGRTLVPLRFISESLGWGVQWKGEDTSVFISSSGKLVTNVENRVSGTADIIEISTSHDAQPSISFLSSPDRMVLDFLGFGTPLGDGATQKAGRIVKNVRWAYHADKYTRVVVDLEKVSEYSVLNKDDKVIVTFGEGKPVSNIKLDNSRRTINLPDMAGAVLKSADDEGFRYVVEGYSDGFETCTVSINNALVNSIEVSCDGEKTSLVINAKRALNIDILNGAEYAVVTYSAKITGKNKIKICIDAGHNYSSYDTGAQGHGLREQDVNFEISKRLGAILENAGFDILLTRENLTDNLGDGTTSGSLALRADMANQFEADLFLSVHANAFTSPAVSGTECYIHTLGNAVHPLADMIVEEITRDLNTVSRGVWAKPELAVIRRSEMPAILIETAFISNAEDAAKLRDRGDDFAAAIANAVCNYYGVPNY